MHSSHVTPPRSPSKAHSSNRGKSFWLCVSLGLIVALFLGVYCFWGLTVSKHVYHPKMMHEKNKLAVRNKRTTTITDQHVAHAENVVREAQKLIAEHSSLIGKMKETPSKSKHSGLSGSEGRQSFHETKGEPQHAEKYNASHGNYESGGSTLNKLVQYNYNAIAGTASSSSGISSTPLSGDKDLVLGMAQNTDPKNLIVFCASLREVTSVNNVTVVIFVNTPIPQLHADIAKKYSIVLKPYDLYSFPAHIQAFHPSTLRWSMMYEYLSAASVSSQYGRVWMIDVRDSYFQRNPFTMLDKSHRGFLTFKGVEDKKIRACGWNG